MTCLKCTSCLDKEVSEHNLSKQPLLLEPRAESMPLGLMSRDEQIRRQIWQRIARCSAHVSPAPRQVLFFQVLELPEVGLIEPHVDAHPCAGLAYGARDALAQPSPALRVQVGARVGVGEVAQLDLRREKRSGKRTVAGKKERETNSRGDEVMHGWGWGGGWGVRGGG